MSNFCKRMLENAKMLDENLSSCTRSAPICFGEKGREKRIAYPRVRSGAQCSCAPAALYLILRSNEAQEKQVHEFAI